MDEVSIPSIVGRISASSVLAEKSDEVLERVGTWREIKRENVRMITNWYYVWTITNNLNFFSQTLSCRFYHDFKTSYPLYQKIFAFQASYINNLYIW